MKRIYINLRPHYLPSGPPIDGGTGQNPGLMDHQGPLDYGLFQSGQPIGGREALAYWLAGRIIPHSQRAAI